MSVPSPPDTYQELIARLQDFWMKEGCVVMQPYHTEVGAGTFNPATFLRCLDSRPWRVAYVEPSIRPADGRYGENPYRFGHYYQYQVLLKPSPDDVLETYVRSLEALGVDPRAHDLRFVEDNWEGPTLGAWGAGWEVWLDGMEVTQFTYFQQVGGLDLDPISVELTYGLERLAMYLQGVESAFDVIWAPGVTWGDVYREYERQWSIYNFEVADTEVLQRHFEDHERECARCLEASIPLAAYDQVLKCSHAFNLLDARGAISVTDRVAYIGRVRNLARRVAQAHLAMVEPEDEAGIAREHPARSRSGARSCPRARARLRWSRPHRSSSACCSSAGWPRAPSGRSSHRGASPSSRRTYPRPRQPIVSCTADRRSRWPSGPMASRRPPATGFARRHHMAAGALVRRDGFVFAEVDADARPASGVLPEVVHGLVEGLAFPKNMRWGSEQLRFARPIRWLVCLHGGDVVDVELGSVRSGRTSRGHRFLGGEIELAAASAYEHELTESFVLADADGRRQAIERGLAAHPGWADPAGVMREVVHLAEWPSVLRGSFPERFLDLPDRVIITVMQSHQRYFPLLTPEGRPRPHFCFVANSGPDAAETVVTGNERVVRGRLDDAAFSLAKDLEVGLEGLASGLGRISFHARAGSLADKTARIEALVAMLADEISTDAQTREHALMAARLAKADQASRLVGEFAELEGYVGAVYARRAGLPEPVCRGDRRAVPARRSRCGRPGKPCRGAGRARGQARQRGDRVRAGRAADGLARPLRAASSGCRRRHDRARPQALARHLGRRRGRPRAARASGVGHAAATGRGGRRGRVVRPRPCRRGARRRGHPDRDVARRARRALVTDPLAHAELARALHSAGPVLAEARAGARALPAHRRSGSGRGGERRLARAAARAGRGRARRAAGRRSGRASPRPRRPATSRPGCAPPPSSRPRSTASSPT